MFWEDTGDFIALADDNFYLVSLTRGTKSCSALLRFRASNFKGRGIRRCALCRISSRCFRVF